MPRKYRPTFCRDCGKRETPPLTLSWTGLCIDCAERRMRANNIQISEHRGEWFEHWRQRSLAALGVFAVDAPPSER